MKEGRRILLAGAAVMAVTLLGCAKSEGPAATEAGAGETEAVGEAASEPMIAVARLEARAGLEITGSVSFTQAEPDAPVMISALVEGLPAGPHGFHVHEVGDCSAEDFTSAAGHFNPMSVPHAGPDDAERHAGDLGNISVGADGVGRLELSSDLLMVEEGPSSVVGRAVILHEKEDDLMSQPTGAAGSRLACGIIERQS